jgi:hypothetical protein
VRSIGFTLGESLARAGDACRLGCRHARLNKPCRPPARPSSPAASACPATSGGAFYGFVCSPNQVTKPSVAPPHSGGVPIVRQGKPGWGSTIGAARLKNCSDVTRLYGSNRARVAAIVRHGGRHGSLLRRRDFLTRKIESHRNGEMRDNQAVGNPFPGRSMCAPSLPGRSARSPR